MSRIRLMWSVFIRITKIHPSLFLSITKDNTARRFSITLFESGRTGRKCLVNLLKTDRKIKWFRITIARPFPFLLEFIFGCIWSYSIGFKWRFCLDNKNISLKVEFGCWQFFELDWKRNRGLFYIQTGGFLFYSNFNLARYLNCQLRFSYTLDGFQFTIQSSTNRSSDHRGIFSPDSFAFW